jgi:hypothetical protein
MVVPFPMPEFKFEVSHVGDGFEIVTSKASADPKSNRKIADTLNVIELRRALEVTNQGVNFMLVTGAGSVMNATKNEHGEFVMNRGILQIQEHKTLEGYNEYFGATMGFMTNTGGNRGYRQWGCAHINPALLLEAAIDNKPLKIEGYAYVPSEKLEVSIVQLVCESMESEAYLASLKAWADQNKDIVAQMKSYTVTAPQITHQLKTFAANRIQKVYDTMNCTYGKLNDPVNINEVGTWSDTSTYMFKASPDQAIKMLREFYAFDEIKRKNVLSLVRISIQCTAELCASYQPILEHGEQSITTQQMIQFLHANTTPVGSVRTPDRLKLNMDFQTSDRLKLNKDFLSILHAIVTSENFNPYESDEKYEYTKDKSVKAVAQGGEKMNMAGDFPRIHIDEMQKTWMGLKSRRDLLLSEQVRLQQAAGEAYISLLTQHGRQKLVAGETPNAALAKLSTELEDVNKSMMKIAQGYGKNCNDCEDSSWRILMGLEILKNEPNFLYEEVKPFVGKGFLPLENMFPSGQVDTMFRSENDKVEAIHFIVKASLQLTSEALKWQSTPVKGKRYSYESCFGLASAPSLEVQNNAQGDKKTPVTREQCSSYLNLLEQKFKNLAGHCYTARSLTSVVKEYKNGMKIELHEIGPEDMLEGTVANAMFKSKDKMDKCLGIKNVDISIAGQNICLKAVPHSQARDMIGATIMNKIKSGDVGKQVWSNTPIDMGKGIYFYDIFSQIGGRQSVSAEITNSNNITSMMDHISAAKALVSRTPNVSFCTSTIAWDGCPEKSKKTKTVTISVPLDPEEDRRIKQIAYEIAPLHAMTKDHLAFVMNDMERVVNVGFEAGKFYGNDITGERLDSETRISHFFLLALTPDGQAQPKYWTNPKGINAVLQSEMQAALPGLHVRVSQLETGIHVMQVVVNS